MDMMNVSAPVGKEYTISDQEPKTTTSLHQGDIVEGMITDVSDMISITFNDKEVKVPRSAVQNAREGQIRKFEIKDISNKSIVLREVGINTERKTSGVLQTNVLSGSKAFSGYIQDKSKEDVAAQTEDVLKQLNKAGKTLTADDYVAMSEQNTGVEDSDSEQFEKMLERIKENRQFTEKHLKRQIEKVDTERKNMERAAVSAASSNAGEIAKRLEQADLPVTDANIARVSTALERASKAPKLTDTAKAYLLENEMNISPENLYKAAYSGNRNGGREQVSALTEEDFAKLTPSVEKLFQSEGIADTEENLVNAKWLLSNELPLTGENLSKLSYLNMLTTDFDVNHIMDLCIQGMEEGRSPQNTDLIQVEKSLTNVDKTVSTMELLDQLTNEAAEQVGEEETISLSTIAAHQQAKSQNANAELKNLTARRQLEEVRQRLTMESCYRLYQQGIEVDTESLESIITELKNMEQQYYKEFFVAADTEPDSKQVEWLQNTEKTVIALQEIPEAIYATTFIRRNQITLQGLYEETVSNTSEGIINQTTSARVAAYETVMTEPRKDLGDSMKKAFASVDHILEELGMECSEANRQAVRSLGYNTMDITNETVTQMKSYQLQVENLVEELTPEVAVKLIQEGENPLEIPLNTLTKQIQDMKQSFPTSSEEKFSEYLYRLDQKKELSADERGAYIGIYRLLHQVDKSDGAAVGAVVKANQELTLNNLLTAVRSKKKMGMDIEATEKFGGMDAVSTGNSISEQINKVFIGRHMTHKVYEKLEPELLATTYETEKTDSIYDLSIEQLYENATNRTVEQEARVSEYQQQQYHRLLTNYDRSKEAAILVANGQPVTANQLEAASILMAEGSTFYRDLKNQAKELDSALSEKIQNQYREFLNQLGEDGELQQSYNRLEEDIDQMLARSMERNDVTTGQVDQLRMYHNCIRLAAGLSSHQTFEVPVVLGEDVVNLKVQLIEGQQGVANMKLQISDPKYGTVDALAVVQKDSVSGYLVSDSRQVADHLASVETEMKQEIESLGITTNQFTISMNKRTKDFYQTDGTEKVAEERPSNQMLYQLAKIFVKYTRQAMAE